MNKYNILLIISAFINLHDQLDASYFNAFKRPLAASIALISHRALTSCANDQSEKNTNAIVGKSEKITSQCDCPKYINSDFYKQVADELKKQIVNFPDDFMQEELIDDSDSIEGLAYEQLTTHAQRVKYLESEFKGYKLSDDCNFGIIVHFMNNLPIEDHNDFFIKVKEFVDEEKSSILSMHHFDKIFVFMTIFKISRIMLGSLYPSADIQTLDAMIKENESAQIAICEFDHNEKLSTAYHEAGHALMFALQPFDQILTQLTLSPQGMVGGAFLSASQYLLYSSISVQSAQHDDMLAQSKNKIMCFLAGGIGLQLLKGEKLTFQEFINLAETLGMGSEDITESDWWYICQAAIYYCQHKDFKLVSIHQEDLEPSDMPNNEELLTEINVLIEECYEEACAILQAHKDALDAIVVGTLEKGVTSGDDIYKLAGVQRPKYYFELTPMETMQRDFTRWLVWTSKRMNFYERNHPQL